MDRALVRFRKTATRENRDRDTVRGGKAGGEALSPRKRCEIAQKRDLLSWMTRTQQAISVAKISRYVNVDCRAPLGQLLRAGLVAPIRHYAGDE